MSALIQPLQAVSGLLWLIVALAVCRSAYRLLFTRRAMLFDAIRSVLFFMGLTQFGFSLRWLVWPRTLPIMEDGEIATWCALYLTSALLALFTLAVVRARGCGRSV